ncbi:MAG: hypothetical protein A2Y62_11725 [Candidatus Fischerbacteria bacterium RBG_13_37_8]|uniref:DUF2780 domain-containing protein n=1 Tax=Candidatus Fischerbacteria bacterium RBG_13_37_8 TaxID=1817863 RepID=A0A1F5VGM8_9BACT|nr:MAG: hypothetical protein A2Y62_11725 [Candidatus Fischerbacteria bacterium RBG_13_37_8]
MDLLKVITTNLVVTDEQARAGIGAIFKAVKTNLPVEDFEKFAFFIPGIEDFIESAPEGSGVGSIISDFISSSDSNMGAFADLVGIFLKLDMDTTMIGKFASLIVSYLQSRGGEEVISYLEKIIK